jgi:hypothetical protein
MRRQNHGGSSRHGRALALAALASALLPAGASAGVPVRGPDPARGDAVTCDFAVHVKMTARRPDVSQIVSGGLLRATTEFEQDRPGRADCAGRINGRLVRGVGPLTIGGAFQDGPLCLTGHGNGSLELTVPRLLSLSGQEEHVRGTFRLDLSETAWRQAGSVVNVRDEHTPFSALSRFAPDAGRGCTVRAGTLTGRLVIGS